ncbi:MAG: aldehyde ferredoxin oxidoreductase family protein [Desulfobacteraceae bacterium]|nr:aldehyde ferredoxin oxidoreductase family protein [Desulfobacteraceae bacterium]MBC2755652.1 aldehyde ferredoxin oxidoreductase family protein [Desulfobacteraceae bacterium]
MTDIKAFNNKVLDIDLTTQSVSIREISAKVRRLYIGGKGLALKLLHDYIKPRIDPLSPDNILVMMTGPTAGTTAPSGNRFTVMCKSPLTGIFAASYVGGKFGISLKKSGYDGIMIRGRSPMPVAIHIENGNVTIRDASDSWGMDTVDFQESRKDEGDWVVIGPAGENLVKFSVIASDKRVAGRCGMGAVMGSKNLKGIVAQGNRKVVVADPDRFQKALKIARKKVRAHDNTGRRLRELGTAQNVRAFGSASIMPVRNFSKSRFAGMEDISAERIRDQHKVKNHGCPGCPIQCGRIGKFNNRELISPEYETIALMGSNLMVGNLNTIAEWNDRLNRLGLDSISTGGVIGFAMELTEKGMLKSDLKFGDSVNIDKTIEDIAYRRGLGDELAEGVKRFSEKYGGEDFANHVKGLEIAGYDPRGCSGQGLGYATANCGATHLSGATHAVETDPLGGGEKSYLSPHGTKAKAHFVVFLQNIMEMTNSAIFCLQTQYPFLEENPAYKYTPKPILRFVMRNLPVIALATTDLSDYCALMSGLMGYKIGRKELYQVGDRIFNLERYMNCREGISKKDDTLPRRMLTDVGENGWASVELDTMLKKYYRLRGWDENGRPTAKVLDRLSILY